MFAQALEQSILPHDLDGFGTMNDIDERNEIGKAHLEEAVQMR